MATLAELLVYEAIHSVSDKKGFILIYDVEIRRNKYDTGWKFTTGSTSVFISDDTENIEDNEEIEEIARHLKLIQ